MLMKAFSLHSLPFLKKSALAMMLAIPAHAVVVSDFESGADGWTQATGDSSSLTWLSTGGNPGGNLQYAEPATGGVDRYGAPAKFLGDQSAMYAGTLSYDLRTTPGENLNNPDIRLIGGGLTLEYYFVASPTGSFANFLVTLDENAGWQKAGGGAPSQAEFQNVLANLTALQISADWSSTSDTTWLDNVVMVPEPSISLLAGFGGLSLLRRRR